MFPRSLTVTVYILFFTPSAYLPDSPSPFRPAAWAALLAVYPDELPSLIDTIPRYGARRG